jgi:hypothetical protein
MSTYLLGIAPRLGLPDDAHFRHDYGVLNADLMPRVCDCLDRASLLNFVLVNKTCHFLGKSSLKYLYFRAEAQRLIAKNAPQAIVIVNLSEMISAVRDQRSAMSGRQKADLLICWIEKICEGYGDPGDQLMLGAGILMNIIQASDCLQGHEQAGVLWEILARSIQTAYGLAAEMLEALQQRSDCLPEAQQEMFKLTCELIDPMGNARSRAMALFDEMLEAQGPLPVAVQARLLAAMCFRLAALPEEMRPDRAAVTKCIANVSSWPLVPRLQVLVSICWYCQRTELKLPMPPLQWLDLEAMLAECGALSESEKAVAIQRTIQLIGVCGKPLLDDEMAASLEAMKHAVRNGWLDALLALPPDFIRDDSMLPRFLELFFKLDCRGEAGMLKALELLCEANRRLSGTMHGDGMLSDFFKLFNGARGMEAIGAMLKKADFISAGADRVTWRSMICFNTDRSKFVGKLDISYRKCVASIRNAASLPQALRLQITGNVLRHGISALTPQEAGKLIEIALSAAAASPAAYAGILRSLAALVAKMDASYRLSMVEGLIASSDTLAESDKVAVLLEFMQTALPLIDDSEEMQSAFSSAAEKLGSTSPKARLHALMALTNIHASAGASARACNYLLDTLLQQCAGLESAQQAALLFCIAFQARRLPAEQAQRMLSRLVEKAGQLDLSAQSRAAWMLLYRLTVDQSLEPDSPSWQAAVEQQCASLPEEQREAVQQAVQTIMHATESLGLFDPFEINLKRQQSEESSEDSLSASDESDADTGQSSASGSSAAEDSSSDMPEDAPS